MRTILKSPDVAVTAVLLQAIGAVLLLLALVVVLQARPVPIAMPGGDAVGAVLGAPAHARPLVIIPASAIRALAVVGLGLPGLLLAAAGEALVLLMKIESHAAAAARHRSVPAHTSGEGGVT